MIAITPTAASALKTAIAGAANPVAGLRLAVEAGGCAGMKYKLGLVADGEPGDLALESEGVRVFVDAMSAPMLDGVTVDFTVSAEGAGFTFDNPAASKACSCGKSFG